MITIKTLSWSNAFSYGADNHIDFSASPLTQLVGKNGHGKSSIALVLEEVLFNKNSKSIKKADILNRYVKDRGYSIAVTFDNDGTEYRIETSVVLHKPLNCLKTILIFQHTQPRKLIKILN